MRSALVLAALGVGCGEGASGPDASVADSATADAGLDAGALGSWREEPPLPAAVQEIAVEVHEGRIWVAGGFEAGAVVTTVRTFDPETGTWDVGPALPEPRHHMALVAHGGDLYALGGMESVRFEPLDTAWVLRAGGDAWEPIASLPSPRGAGAADAVGSVIVLAGGNDGAGRLAEDTLIYEPATDTWRVGAALPTPREHLAAVAVDGELWALAGRMNSLRSNTSLVHVYDPELDAWREGPPMITPRGGFDAALLGGAIYCVGGEQPDRALDEVDRLDLATERWSAAPPVPTPRHGHGVVALAGRLWVVGGADRPIFAAVAAVESFAP